MEIPMIPRPQSLKVSLKKGRARLRWVSRLMIPGKHEWNIHMLKITCLYSRDVEEVRKIRLSKRVEEDVLAWYYEKNSIFTGVLYKKGS
jgi:hypothetical protein